MLGIYKITSPTNRVYIGQSIDLEKRIKSYKLVKKEQPFIYRSIQKYGYENHKFEIIHKLPNDISQDILNNYEILYWQLYKDCGFKMLNAKEPGSNGKLNKETYREIGRKNSIHLKGTKQSNKTKEKRSKSLTENWKLRKKKVYQYDLEGNFIKEWDSTNSIILELGITGSNLSKCLSNKYGRKTVSNFIWKYDKINNLKLKHTILSTKRKGILQFSKNGEFIREWESALIASKELSINRGNMIVCMKGFCNSAGNYIWKYKN